MNPYSWDSKWCLCLCDAWKTLSKYPNKWSRVTRTKPHSFSQAWMRSQITKQCVTFCKAAFMSKVDPCGWAVDVGQRQLGEADFISPCHTLKNTHTTPLFKCQPVFYLWTYSLCCVYFLSTYSVTVYGFSHLVILLCMSVSGLHNY